MLNLTLKGLGKISAKVRQALQAQHSSKFKQLDIVSRGGDVGSYSQSAWQNLGKGLAGSPSTALL